MGTATPDIIDYNDSPFGPSANFPGVTEDDFALEALGRVDVVGGTDRHFYPVC